MRTSLLLVSASLFITVWHDDRMRAHYLLPAVAWLVASFLLTLNMSPAATRLTVLGLGGLTLLVCGIGDHLLVTRTLAARRQALEDQPRDRYLSRRVVRDLSDVTATFAWLAEPKLTLLRQVS